MAALDWSEDFAAIGIELPPATTDELEVAASYAVRSPEAAGAAHAEVGYQDFAEVNVWELSRRERDIYEAGFYAGHLSRQPEVDAMEDLFKQADNDADRYYRAAFDHDYHDCAVHENRGKYRGAATRVLDDAWGDDWDAVNPSGR